MLKPANLCVDLCFSSLFCCTGTLFSMFLFPVTCFACFFASTYGNIWVTIYSLCQEGNFSDVDTLLAYQHELGEFLCNSALFDGDNTSYVDDSGMTNVTVNRPVQPAGTLMLSSGGDIICNWHRMTLAQVCESVCLQLDMVNNNVHHQNLVWIFSYIMDGLDADLKAFVLCKIFKLDTNIGRTRPIAFIIVVQRVLQATENLAQKVIDGWIALRLTHFEGKSMIECIFTLCNMLIQTT